MYFFLKVLISAVIIAAVSELGRRSVLLAALVASLPINSVLAICWLYRDTRDEGRVIALCHGIFWALLPSLIFLLLFPLLLKAGMRFGTSMIASASAMLAGYALYAWLLGRLGIRI